MGASAERAGQAFDPATFKHEGHALCECHAAGYLMRYQWFQNTEILEYDRGRIRYG